MEEPMTIPECGHSFEKKAIADWLKKYPTCPMCRKGTNPDHLVPNYQLKNVIEQYKANKLKQKK